MQLIHAAIDFLNLVIKLCFGSNFGCRMMSCESDADCLDVPTFDTFLYPVSRTFERWGNIVRSCYGDAAQALEWIHVYLRKELQSMEHAVIKQ